MPDADVIVIGSGPAGVHSALPLIEAGVRVRMLDGGNMPTVDPTTEENFEDVRSLDAEQHNWFLGKNCSGIPLQGLQGGLGGGQISGNRAYVVQDSARELPLSTNPGTQVIQSLAKGGLGAAWGAACAYLTPEELKTMGISPNTLEQHYDRIAQRIGISGPQNHLHVQPPWQLDHHALALQHAYENKKSDPTLANITVTQPHTALLTEDLGDRKKTLYADMEYWADPRRSIYRPQYMLEEMLTKENFSYQPGVVVERVEERSGECIVSSRSKGDVRTQVWNAKKVILAAGTVGSARILLQSRRLFDVSIPFIGKPHSLIACIHPRMLGKAGPRERTSLCQLLVTNTATIHGCATSCAQLYSYRSLLLFRLLSSLPLPAPEAFSLLRIFAPMLVIADLRFPAFHGTENTLCIKNTTPFPSVEIHMHVTQGERLKRKNEEQHMKEVLRSLGLLPIRTLELPEASTSHYAGTIPKAAEGTSPLTVDAECRLHGSQNIFIADASTFAALPAKPHTFTLMANADRIGTVVAEQCA